MSRLIRFHRWWLVLIIVVIALSVTLAAVSAARVTPSETTLYFKGLITESQQRTLQLTVDGGPITTVQVIRHDLIDAASGAVILSKEVVVEPLKIDRVDDTADLAVTLTGVKRGGHYVGTLDLRYVDQGVTQTLPITLEAELSAVPSVDATADSKRLTWFVTAGTTSTQPIFLTQKAAGDAYVQEASILVMRGGKGQALPDGLVHVVGASLPMTLTSSSARAITVAVNSGVPAGEYNGTLLVKVRDQTASLEVPIVVKAKDGPVWPLVALVMGLATAAVLGWWNSDGQKSKDAADALIAFREQLKTTDRLQADQVESIIASVEAAAHSLNAGEKADTVDAKVKAAQQKLIDEQKKTDDLLAEIDKQIEQAKTLKPGDGVRPAFLDRLTALSERTRKGELKKLADAVADKNDVQLDLNFWAKVVELVASVPEADRKTATDRLNEAKSLNAMQKVLMAYQLDQALLTLKQGRTFGTADTVRDLLGARPQLDLSVKTQLALRGGALVVGVIAYAFALVVGFITLYVINDTFGADPQQYLSLFVWGAVIETVRGKTVTLANLKAIMPSAGGNAAPNPKPGGV